MAVTAVMFNGEPPNVADGDRVEVREASGTWRPTVARGAARYDFPNAIGRWCYLTVPVDWPGAGSVVNWPAEHVRVAAS